MLDQISHAVTPSTRTSVAGLLPRDQHLRPPRSCITERASKRELRFHEPIPNPTTPRCGPGARVDNGSRFLLAKSTPSAGQSLAPARMYSRLPPRSCRGALRDGQPTKIPRRPVGRRLCYKILYLYPGFNHQASFDDVISLGLPYDRVSFSSPWPEGVGLEVDERASRTAAQFTELPLVDAEPRGP